MWPQDLVLLWGYELMSWINMSQVGNTPHTCRQGGRDGQHTGTVPRERGLLDSPNLTPFTLAGHLDSVLTQKHERRRSPSRTRLGQPPATSSTGAHHPGHSGGKPPASLSVPPAQQGADEEGHSKPRTSPWVTARVSTRLPPSKPYQALT